MNEGVIDQQQHGQNPQSFLHDLDQSRLEFSVDQADANMQEFQHPRKKLKKNPENEMKTVQKAPNDEHVQANQHFDHHQ